MITHDGRAIPAHKARWDPQDKDWCYVSWADVLGTATIQQSAWAMADGSTLADAGWTEHDTRIDVTVSEDGTDYEYSNGILLSAAASVSGRQEIANQVTLSDGRILERSFAVIVGNI